MSTRKIIFSLCAICALAVGAFAAQGASAVSQTKVTCVKTGTQIPGTLRFKDEHCKESTGSPTAGEYFHEAIAPKVSRVRKLWNFIRGLAQHVHIKVQATIGGLNTIIDIGTAEGTGTAENNETGGEMYAEELFETLIFEEVTVTNRACEFFGITPGTGVKTLGTFKTQPIRTTTKGQAAGIVKFEPQTVGGKLGEFELTGASCPEALKGLYPMFGSFLSQKTEGATIPFSHLPITEAKTLRLKNATTGPIAGIEGKLISAGASDTEALT